MAVISFTVNPSLSLTSGPGQFPFPSGLDTTQLDEVRLFGLLLEVSRMFAISRGVVISASDTVSITVTCDGTVD